MYSKGICRKLAWLAGMLSLPSILALILATATQSDLRAGGVCRTGLPCMGCVHDCPPIQGLICDDLGGTWYWLRSPDEEKRVIAGLYNRYCIRCHGVDGRGVWDIPGVPDFTNPRWQASRSDGQIARIILEGRGAVMPPFRGTLTLEEACAMARYLRTFVPGTEASKPDLGKPKKGDSGPPEPGK